MTRIRKIIFSISAVVGLLIICAIVWFYTYHYFSPLHKPCNEISVGMSYDEAKEIMNPFFSDPTILSNDSMYQSGTKRRMDFSDSNGVFCLIELKDNKVLEISFGREF